MPSKRQSARRRLRFLWWNPQDFGHFSPPLQGQQRWPSSPAEYIEKCARVDRAIKASIRSHGRPDVLFLCETSAEAAASLRDRVFPRYLVASLDALPGEPDFQVAALFRGDLGFAHQHPLAVQLTPDSTRPMLVLDHVGSRHRIRFIASHWTSRIGGEPAEETRVKAAMAVNEHIFDFLDGETSLERRHVVVIGDLNDEPFSQSVSTFLHAHRSRERSTGDEHWANTSAKRALLYNCAWALLGEQRPHDGSEPGGVNAAGTYYQRRERSWHTFDQIIVTGSLLTSRTPFLDESSLAILRNAAFMDTDRKPRKFLWVSGAGAGLSDHLPVVGSITLAR